MGKLIFFISFLLSSPLLLLLLFFISSIFLVVLGKTGVIVPLLCSKEGSIINLAMASNGTTNRFRPIVGDDYWCQKNFKKKRGGKKNLPTDLDFGQ